MARSYKVFGGNGSVICVRVSRDIIELLDLIVARDEIESRSVLIRDIINDGVGQRIEHGA